MNPASAQKGTARYYAFGPAVRSFSWTYLIAIFLGLFLCTQTYVLSTVGGGLDVWRSGFPYGLMIGQLLEAAVSAWALVWLSCQLASAWQIGVIFGAVDALATCVGVQIGEIVRHPSLDSSLSFVWAWRTTMANVVWGILLIVSIATAYRLSKGLRFMIVPAALIGWCLFGVCNNLMYSSHHPFAGLVRWLVSGAIFGVATYLGLRSQQKDGAHEQSSMDLHSNRLRKGFYLTVIGAGSIIGYLLVTSGISGSSSGVFSIGLFLTMLVSIAMLVLIWNMWSAIQDGHTRISPRRAVGLLFIPLFNIGWVLGVLGAFPQEYNAFRNRHSVQSAPLARSLFIAWATLLFASFMLSAVAYNAPIFWFPLDSALLLMQMVAIAKTCDAVNAIRYPNDTTLAGAGPSLHG